MPPIRHAPAPTHTFFDPFNSSSTGHQRAENRFSSSNSWRDLRSRKLTRQFGDGSGRGGEGHVSDAVGADSQHFGRDGRKETGSWETGALELREKGWQDIRSLIRKRERHESGEVDHQDVETAHVNARGGVDIPDACRPSLASRSEPPTQVVSTNFDAQSCSHPNALPSQAQIFRSLTLYLNGSAFSSGISDQKLRSIFVQSGGSVSISLGRRTVSHVILSSTCSSLAAGKVQKEIAKLRGKSIKYVTADWVVDSVKAGKRLPEGRYQTIQIAMKGQPSVLGKLAQAKPRQNDDRHKSG